MPIFGLDIGSTSIKAVQLDKKSDQQYSLLAAGITTTPGRGMASDLDKDLELVAESIKKLITDTKITAKQVNISLPESLVFTRLIQLPYLTDEEVVAAISWQAEPYIPIPVDQASVDHQIVGRTEPQGANPGSTSVLLVASPKSLIQKYIKVAEMSGLTVTNMETELLSLSRSISIPNQTALVADLGAVSSDFGIIKNGQIMVSRSVATGGWVLTRSIATSLNLAADRAEEYKKSYGLSEQFLEGKVKEALTPVFEVITEEMKKTIQYYKAEIGKEDQVTVSVISGGTSAMPDVSTKLAEDLGLEVVIGDPFAKVIKNEQTAKTLSLWSPMYAIAVGLAQNI